MRSPRNLLPSNESQVFDSGLTFFKEMSRRLEESSKVVPYQEFNELFKRVILQCIKKIENDKSFYDNFEEIKKWMLLYSYDVEILARVKILECVIMKKTRREEFQECFSHLESLKHLLMGSGCEFLLPKVLIIESQVCENENNLEKKYTVLKNCIEFGDRFAIECLKLCNEFRLEFADSMIVSHYELYKLIKDTDPIGAKEHLSKAYHAALKNYGLDHFSTQMFSQTIAQETNFLNNLDKTNRKAITIINESAYKKYQAVKIFYSWEEELLIFQLIKSKNSERVVLAESSMQLKADNSKLSVLKSKSPTSMFTIEISYLSQDKEPRLIINEDAIHKYLEFDLSKPSIPNLRQLNKTDLFKKTEEPGSSSSDDDDIMPIDSQDKVMRRFGGRDRSHFSREKSREKDKSRDNMTSRN